ncbi:MAG: hypothetical protein KAI79_01770 [Bacteroidales bacterium]|nr:hypothetical protein [Bacteroidales bacterium]
MNYRNYSQKTNYTCGTEAFDLLPFYATAVNIPGVNFSLPEVGGRSGTKLSVSADNVSFNNLSLEILVDEDYKIYNEIMDIIFDHINVESGSFADFSFDFWCEVNDDMGKKVMKIEYYNCKIESVGDLSLDSSDDVPEQMFSLDIRFDYFKIIKNEITPELTV